MENFFKKNPYYFDESFEMVYFIKEFGLLSCFKEFDVSQDNSQNFEDFENNGNSSVPHEIENYYQKKTIFKSEIKLSHSSIMTKRNFTPKNSRKMLKNVPDHCVFCENNKMPASVYKGHRVRDAFGVVICPKLRAYVCPICFQSGDNAHTLKYCPKKPIITMKETEVMEEKYKMMKKNKFNN